MKEELAKEIMNYKLSNRSLARGTLLYIQENNLSLEISQLVLDNLIYLIDNNKPLTNILNNIGDRVLNYVKTKLDTKLSIKVGEIFLDILTKTNHIQPVKFAIQELGGQEQWHLTVVSDEFMDIINANKLPELKANSGYHEWTSPIMRVADRKIDIVKKARIYNLLHNYRYTNMPSVYNVLNKLGRTEWKINEDMLNFLDIDANESNLLPKKITKKERELAKNTLNKINRNALYKAEIRFKQLELRYSHNKALRIANKIADDYRQEHRKESINIISKWSKERDFRKCIDYAKEYKNDTLNFLYSCDSRGRIYTFNQNYLNPQGADFAKALLEFKNPKPVSTYDLMVTIANHGGQDKLSYEDRIQWVKDNNINILEVGTNPWSKVSMSFLNDSGIAQEAKSKFQFIASAIEWRKLNDWISKGNNQDDFLCSIPVAYDATNSGLQILSAIGRDDYVAPYVNITSTPKPGDVYQLIGNAVCQKQPIEKLLPIECGDKAWRKIVKRNVMTKNYAATRYGMGTQQWEDKPDANDDSTGVWHTLTFPECRKLGEVTYDTCSEYLQKASELMETMKRAVRTCTSSIIKWTLPNGFTAFQVRDKSEEANVKIVLGSIKVALKYYTYTGKPNKQQHQSAIAPDVVHSIDAWLLNSIVERLPNDANLAFVHDAYGSDSCYGNDIQEIAKQAYYEVSSRTVMKEILLQISEGEEIELPKPGNWKPEEIFKSDYIVC